MANQEPAIDPSHQFDILKNPTVQPIIEDLRGPLVYDRDLTPNLNGSDPNYNKKNGV